jgi:MFS family permease
MVWPRTLGALSSRNYRLYFGGQCISLIGTWMTQTASLWLVYHLSSSAFLLGMVGFASQVPIFFLAPFAGVWVDRMNRHRLLLVTQFLSMLQSFALAWLTFTGRIDPFYLVLLSLVQGVINAFDMPTRQALVVAFVERREHLGNAIALNSSMFNLARLIGPALGGLVVAAVGAAGCYLIDGFSYLAVLGSLLAMRIPPRAPGRERRHAWLEFREAFHYTFRLKPMRLLMLTIGAMSFFGFSYSVLTPIFARDVFHGDAKVLGYLMSASGIGALVGAGYLSTRTSIRGLGKVISLGGGLIALGLLSFALSRWLPLSLLAMSIAGAGGVLLMASSNTVLQTIVEEDKRGRVMSLFTMAFTGTAPLGNLAMGALANKISAPTTLVISSLFCAAIAFAFFRKLPEIRAAAAPILAKINLAETG